MHSKPLPTLTAAQEKLLHDNLPLAEFLAWRFAQRSAHKRLGCSGQSAHWLAERYYEDYIGIALDRLVKAVALYDASRCDSFGAYAGVCITRRLVEAKKQLKRRRLWLSAEWRDMGLESRAEPVTADQFSGEIDRLLAELLPARWVRILKRRIIDGESNEDIGASQVPPVGRKSIDVVVRQAIQRLRASTRFMEAITRHASYKLPSLDTASARSLSKSLFR